MKFFFADTFFALTMHDKVFKQDEYQLIDIYEVKEKVYYS